MDKEDDLKGKPFVVAVTGGIASGKTSVCELFHEAFNIETIDTDKLSREAVTSGSRCLEEIISVFGEKVIDHTKSLNRPMMRKIIFEDSSLRQKLENIIHPEVKRLIDCKIEENWTNPEVQKIINIMRTKNPNLVKKQAHSSKSVISTTPPS